MALLQIAEPGQSTEPHRRKVAVGIDLGTTHSLVASVRSGSAEVLADETGEVLLPSAVRYGRDGVIAVGTKAYAEAGSDPTNTIVSVKRLMGRGLLDARAQGTPYELVANGEGGMVGLHTVAGEVSPVQVSAEILRVLKERAQAHWGLGIADQLDGAVITVPAYFDDAQRQATKDAARLAGLPVLRLINEPTAAALAYGLDHGAEGAYAIFDLGGGTFDISILRLTRGIFEVMATGGNTNLGGDDFDRLLADEWLSQWGRLRPSLSAKENRRLALLARKLKEELTHQADDHAELSATWEGDDGACHVARITRARFNEITADLVKETLRMSHRVLEDANLSVKDLNGVVLVGGATRMPCIRLAVKEFFQQDPKVDLDPDRVVAIGAALQANLLVGNRQADDDWLLLDVLPLSLGIETMGGLTERIIPRNTAIPVARAQEFTTFKDGQTAMSIHVVQGEREMVSECRSLARFELRGIPPMVAGRARIAVTFQVDADGLLSVTARESTTGAQSSVMVKPSYGLTDAQIADMLTDAFSSAKEDMNVRCLREAQVDAQRLLEAISSALREDGDLLSKEERTAVDEAMELLRTTCGGKELELLQDRTKALGLLTDDFAARRMDRAVARALSGKSIHNMAG